MARSAGRRRQTSGSRVILSPSGHFYCRRISPWTRLGHSVEASRTRERGSKWMRARRQSGSASLQRLPLPLLACEQLVPVAAGARTRFVRLSKWPLTQAQLSGRLCEPISLASRLLASLSAASCSPSEANTQVLSAPPSGAHLLEKVFGHAGNKWQRKCKVHLERVPRDSRDS